MPRAVFYGQGNRFLVDRGRTVVEASYCPLPNSWHWSNLFSFDDGSGQEYDVDKAHSSLSSMANDTNATNGAVPTAVFYGPANCFWLIGPDYE